MLGRGKLCPFFLEGGGGESERSAGVSLRIQCLGGENCVLFFFLGGGERSLSGVLVFLYGFSAWEGKTVYFFFGGCWYFFTDSVPGRGKLCPFFLEGGGASLSGVLVFLYGFSAWEGKTVSFFFFWGGGGVERSLSGVLVFLYGFSAWEGKTVSNFFLGGGGAESERSAGISLLGRGKLCPFFFGGGESGV